MYAFGSCESCTYLAVGGIIPFHGAQVHRAGYISLLRVAVHEMRLRSHIRLTVALAQRTERKTRLGKS